MDKRKGVEDFSHEVFDAMSGCLACKSCAGQCPVKVNVPEFRSRFLELYHSRYLRPLKDYLIGSLEFSIPHFAKLPSLYNGLMRLGVIQAFLKNHAGMVDSPLLSRIDPALEEAAQLDGANRWHRFRAVTLPTIWPAMIFVTVASQSLPSRS